MHYIKSEEVMAVLTVNGIFFVMYSQNEVLPFNIPHRNGVRFGGKTDRSHTIYVIFEKNNIYWVTEYILDFYRMEYKVLNNYHSD